MKLDAARYERYTLILTTRDPQAMRVPYDFKPGNYELKKVKVKRSRDSNSYAWVLMAKIADVVGRSKDDVYLDMLKRYGQTGVAKIQNEDASRFIRQFKYVEPHEHLNPEAKAQYFRFWVGSSNYNTEEMTSFINGIVDDAKDLGIEVLTPAELERMNAAWHHQADEPKH